MISASVASTTGEAHACAVAVACSVLAAAPSCCRRRHRHSVSYHSGAWHADPTFLAGRRLYACVHAFACTWADHAAKAAAHITQSRLHCLARLHRLAHLRSACSCDPWTACMRANRPAALQHVQGYASVCARRLRSSSHSSWQLAEQRWSARRQQQEPQGMQAATASRQHPLRSLHRPSGSSRHCLAMSTSSSAPT